MQQYKELLQRIMTTGNTRGDRTGTGTRSVFGHQMRFNLQDGFPLVTLKRTPFHLIIAELIWFLEGSTDNNRLRELSGVQPGQRGIWDDWAVSADGVRTTLDGEPVVDFRHEGKLGPIYSKQWRHWSMMAYESVQDGASWDEGIDQITLLIKGLLNNPYSRRHIVSAWNVADLPDESMSPQLNVVAGRMALAPCHALFQCYVRDMTLEERLAIYNRSLHSLNIEMALREDRSDAACHAFLDKESVPVRFLDLQMYQRSTDVPVGLCFNIASYALLTHMLAHACGYAPGEFVWTGGDNHCYLNQIDEVNIMLEREPRPMPSFQLPDGFDLSVILNGQATRQDVLVLAEQLQDYNPHPAIKIAVAV